MREATLQSLAANSTRTLACRRYPVSVTQNAHADYEWVLGPLTMPGYFNRTMQTAGEVWNPARFVPDLVVISLGGNDYNHQGSRVPSNESFTKHYVSMLRTIHESYEAYSSNVRIIAACGMGSPIEKIHEPDNNRCRPCPRWCC